MALFDYLVREEGFPQKGRGEAEGTGGDRSNGISEAENSQGQNSPPGSLWGLLGSGVKDPDPQLGIQSSGWGYRSNILVA